MKCILTLLLTLTLSNCLHAQGTFSGYDFAWGDEFNGAALDTSKWTPANTNIPTNNSRQDYLPGQVTVSNGNMVITSENSPSRGLPYRSGLVTSTVAQKHGRWDIRAKLPTSRGMWPAIWLLADAPWPSEGEIDIMENRGDSPHTTSSAFHYGTNTPFEHNFVFQEQTAAHDGELQNYHDSFHTYSVEWDPNQVRFYVDNVHHYTVRDDDVGGFLSNNVGEMRLIINTAVGGTFLDNPDNTTVWPQTFEVDYVHAYTRSATGPVLQFDNGGFEAQGGSLAHWTTFGKKDFNNISSGNDFVKEGDEALKLFGQFDGGDNFSGVEQGLSIQGGQELVAKASSFVSSLDSIVGSGNRVELKIDYYSELYANFGSADYLGSESIIIADGSSIEDVWRDFELRSIAPNGAVEARVVLVFAQSNNASGAVWVDGVSFTAVPEPSSGIVVALFGLAALSRRKKR